MRREQNGRIVNSNHKLIGKHVISLTVPLTLDKASEIAQRLSSMPSCIHEREMFEIKRISVRKFEGKNYIVARKLCIGDSVDFIDYSGN